MEEIAEPYVHDFIKKYNPPKPKEIVIKEPTFSEALAFEMAETSKINTYVSEKDASRPIEKGYIQ